jgi:hypothetical protein
MEEKPVFLPFWKEGLQVFRHPGAGWERLEFNQIL